MFDTKVAILVLDDLPLWQKLNVTAFLATGIAGAALDAMGEPYEDGAGRRYARLLGQPILIFAATPEDLLRAHRVSLEKRLTCAAYVRAMFSTGHDAANREAFRAEPPMLRTWWDLLCEDPKKTSTKPPRAPNCTLEVAESKRLAIIRRREFPMLERYDPLRAPASQEWLDMGELSRIALVENYHRKAGIRLPNARLHATFHVIVENQVALGDETPAAKTLERLMNEGVDRHEAIHAVASVLSDHITDVLSGSSLPSDPNAPYYAALEKLTVESWRRDYGVPSPSRRAKSPRKSPHR